MRLRSLLIPAVAAAAVSCSSAPDTTAGPVVESSSPAPTTQAELDNLRAENARLRAQLGVTTHENAVIKTRAAIVEAKQKKIERGKLEAGMTVQDANQAINGSPNLYRDTCQLLSETDTAWTYRILSGAQTLGPGSGGAAAVGTNMRGDRAVPVQAWLCTFDRQTGKLTSFRRDLEK